LGFQDHNAAQRSPQSIALLWFHFIVDRTKTPDQVQSLAQLKVIKADLGQGAFGKVSVASIHCQKIRFQKNKTIGNTVLFAVNVFFGIHVLSLNPPNST
jgi:hypothetical protein